MSELLRNIEIPNEEEKKNTKASERFIRVIFFYPECNKKIDTWVPIENRRANINLTSKDEIIDYLNKNVDSSITPALKKFVADRKGHDRRYGIAPDKIKEELGWYPETPFEKGIVLTIDWYLDNEDWMKNVTSGNYQKYYEEMYKAKA